MILLNYYSFNIGADVNQRSRYSTPLFEAISNTKIFKLLLDRGASLNSSDKVHSYLLRAISIDNYDIVKLLLNRIDLNQYNKGHMALIRAILIMNNDIIELLFIQYW